MSDKLTLTMQLIKKKCAEIEEMLIEKNRKYGDSALKPMRLMSKSDPEEQINVRIDDKLSRLFSGQLDEDEDVIKDLIGYFILKLIYREADASTSKLGIEKEED